MSSLSVLAVDLALRRYADFGFAILRPAGARCEARLLGATELGLEALGFRRLRNASRLSLPLALEIFPTAAWRGLGLEPLPAKNKCPVGHLLRYRRALARRARVRFAGELTHDGLQAVAGGLAGIGIVAPDRAACVLVGRPLPRQGGSWREGYIAVPQLRGRNRPAGTRA